MERDRCLQVLQLHTRTARAQSWASVELMAKEALWFVAVILSTVVSSVRCPKEVWGWFGLCPKYKDFVCPLGLIYLKSTAKSHLKHSFLVSAEQWRSTLNKLS